MLRPAQRLSYSVILIGAAQQVLICSWHVLNLVYEPRTERKGKEGQEMDFLRLVLANRCLFLSLSYLMMQRLTFPFPFDLEPNTGLRMTDKTKLISTGNK